jgi:hypothetical protein
VGRKEGRKEDLNWSNDEIKCEFNAALREA